MKSITDFYTKKQKNEKFSMITCYDFSFAQLIEKSNIDTVLIGDSVAQVIHGHPNTLHATVDMMALHTSAVARAIKTKFIVTDMPFLSNRRSLDSAMNDVQKLMTAGAHALKIEGAHGHLDLIHHIVESGVPVMGHLGLTPQSIFQLGGPKIQGKSKEQAEQLLEQASLLEKAGCFALVLECIPSALADKITQSIDIATIGIGAGPQTDGQVLVLQDALGMNASFNPKFLKKYAQLHDITIDSLNKYAQDVVEKKFPTLAHSYESKG